MTGNTIFQGEMITKEWKYIDEILKSSFPEPLGQIQSWHKASLGKVDICLNKGPRPFPRADNYEIAKIHWRNLKFSFSRTTGPVSTKLGAKHPKGNSSLFKWRAMPKKRYIDKIWKSFSPEPLCIFQPNLTQTILGWRGLEFLQNILQKERIFF